MSSLKIEKVSIVDVKADVIVNAANNMLAAGSGVCGAIFKAAGKAELTEACSKIGGCKTGDAVITPGFNLPSKYIIHTVGPIWSGGNNGEADLLYSCYEKSLELAMRNDCHSIVFPLISAGIYRYPLDGAWKQAISACISFIETNMLFDMDITFAVLDENIMNMGIDEISRQMDIEEMPKAKNTFFHGCPELENAIRTWHTEEDADISIIIDVIIDELQENGEIIVPVDLIEDADPEEDGIPFDLRMIEEDGGLWFAAFTNDTEAQKGEDATTSTIPLGVLLEIACKTDICDGLIINPFGEEQLALPKDVIPAIFAEAMPKTRSDIYVEESLEAFKNEDYDKAFILCKKATEDGNVMAISNLGYCYYHGYGTEVNIKKAKECFHMAAIFGDITAMYILGDIYRENKDEGESSFSTVLYIKALVEAKEKDVTDILPDIIIRVLRYCCEAFDQEELLEMAEEAAIGFRERIDEGSEESEILLNEVEEFISSLKDEKEF